MRLQLSCNGCGEVEEEEDEEAPLAA